MAIVLSDKDAGRVGRAVRWHERNNNPRHRMRPKNIPAGGHVPVYATITTSLRRENPVAVPVITAVTAYKIKLLSEGQYPPWSLSHGTYTKGDLVKYSDGKDYIALVTHDSTIANPTNPSFWSEAFLTAYIDGYKGTNLLEVLPVFLVGDIIEVVYLPDYDSTGAAIGGTEKWYIKKTATRVEITINAGTPVVEVLCSMAWNFDEDRAMAVYG